MDAWALVKAHGRAKHVKNNTWWCAWNPAVSCWVILAVPVHPLPLPSLSLVVRIMQQAADDYYESIEVHIRWPEGHDLVLSMSPKETVSTLKQKVSSTLWPHSSIPPYLHWHSLSLSLSRFSHQHHTLAARISVSFEMVEYWMTETRWLTTALASLIEIPTPKPRYLHLLLFTYIVRYPIISPTSIIM